MRLRNFAILAGSSLLLAQAPETVIVKSAAVSRQLRLPGELLPYLKVELRARVSGYVESVEVDRGSVVKKGQTLVRLSAPELAAQVAEAEARTLAVEAQRAEAEAKALGAQSTFERLKQAALTPGVIAGNELVVAEKQAEAMRATVKALEAAAAAARSSVAPLKQMQSYLEVTAPFDGVITERHAHPGELAGPGTSAPPLLVLEQNSRLRLVVAVPESDIGGIRKGTKLAFRVPAYPGRQFSGTIARVATSLDAKTRTMPIELDVVNPGGALAPGMYPEVDWSSHRSRPSLLVPPTSVVTTTERTFVIRVRDGKAEWVNVMKGALAGEMVEVLGDLREGDRILRRATDEIRDGSPVAARP